MKDELEEAQREADLAFKVCVALWAIAIPLQIIVLLLKIYKG